jgi:5,10-methylenetetrahydromethanopterin reductase
MKNARIGAVLGSAIGPEQLADGARVAEESGLGHLWLSEDYFFTGGISGATQALSVTNDIEIGLGVVSAVTRHPALLAMEIATVARQFPGRFRPGIGLGVPGWLKQMGAMPSSPLTAMRECVTSVRALLEGRELTNEGEQFTFDRVSLTYPPLDVPPLSMGVSGPRMLRLSGEIADGTLLSVGAGADYVRWAREEIERGRRATGRVEPHDVTLFALCSVDEKDPARARAAVRKQLAFYRSAGGVNALTEAYGISDQVAEMRSRGGVEVFLREMPDQWVEDLAVAGHPGECAEKLEALFAAGADRVALFPTPAGDAAEVIRRIGSQVLPLLD